MIRLRNIKKSFTRPDGSRLEVLKDIDCRVRPGEFVAIVGPSGSGKSTLMNILGLLDQPDEGEYALGGGIVSGLGATERARIRNRRIGFVFQQFHLLHRTTAVENVELPLVYSDVTQPEERAVNALCRVGLEDRLDHYPSQLSGGEQQRVAIARALYHRPKLVLCDEPTGNLDRQTAGDILEVFEQLSGQGVALLIATHDAAIAKSAGRVMTLRDGRVS